jgi:hypothetical protein
MTTKRGWGPYPGRRWFAASILALVAALLVWIFVPHSTWAAIAVAVLVFGVQIAQQIRHER